MGVKSTIGDPVLVGKGGWAINNPLLRRTIPGCRGFHFDGVISKPDFSQREATDLLEIVNLVE
jgi:hypothetical protein